MLPYATVNHLECPRISSPLCSHLAVLIGDFVTRSQARQQVAEVRIARICGPMKRCRLEAAASHIHKALPGFPPLEAATSGQCCLRTIRLGLVNVPLNSAVRPMTQIE